MVTILPLVAPKMRSEQRTQTPLIKGRIWLLRFALIVAAASLTSCGNKANVAFTDTATVTNASTAAGRHVTEKTAQTAQGDVHDPCTKWDVEGGATCAGGTILFASGSGTASFENPTLIFPHQTLKLIISAAGDVVLNVCGVYVPPIVETAVVDRVTTLQPCLTSDGFSITTNLANEPQPGVLTRVLLLPMGEADDDSSVSDWQFTSPPKPPTTDSYLTPANAMLTTSFDEGIGGTGWTDGDTDTACVTPNPALRLTSTGGAYSQAMLGKTLDLSAHHGAARLRFCVDDPTKLSNVYVYFIGPANDDYYACNIAPNKLTHGENDVTIRLSDCSSSGVPVWSNITHLQVAVRSQDRGMSVVVFRDLYALNTYKPATGPSPVLFTFDDSNEQSRTIVAPKLAQYGWAATANLTAHVVGNAGQLSIDQILDLQKNFGWSFAYHGCDHIRQDQWASAAAVSGDYDCWFRWMQSNGIRPTRWLSYPADFFSATSVAASRLYFYLAHDSVDTYTPYWGPNFQDMRLPALSLKWNLPTLKAAVDSAITDGSTLIFYCDHFAEPASGSDCSIKNFDALVDYLASKGSSVKVMTAQQYIDQYWP